MHKTKEAAVTARDDFGQLLKTTSGALVKPEGRQSRERIEAFAGCVSSVICSADAYVEVSLLIAKAKELDEIRGSSAWKKFLLKDDYTSKIEDVVNEIKKATEIFCVSSP
jgi:hypothetical protein